MRGGREVFFGADARAGRQRLIDSSKMGLSVYIFVYNSRFSKFVTKMYARAANFVYDEFAYKFEKLEKLEHNVANFEKLEMSPKM